VKKLRDWRAIRQAAAGERLAAFRGGPRERFHASLAMAVRSSVITGSPVPVDKCLRRWSAVVAEILSEPR